MDDGGTRDVVAEVLVRECVALAVTLALLWAIGPGRVLVPAWIARAKALMRPVDVHEGQARQFAAEVSRWDHEQTAKAHRRPAAGGPCGCGQLSPVGHRRYAASHASVHGPLQRRDDRG